MSPLLPLSLAMTNLWRSLNRCHDDCDEEDHDDGCDCDDDDNEDDDDFDEEDSEDGNDE